MASLHLLPGAAEGTWVLITAAAAKAFHMEKFLDYKMKQKPFLELRPEELRRRQSKGSAKDSSWGSAVVASSCS